MCVCISFSFPSFLFITPVKFTCRLTLAVSSVSVFTDLLSSRQFCLCGQTRDDPGLWRKADKTVNRLFGCRQPLELVVQGTCLLPWPQLRCVCVCVCCVSAYHLFVYVLAFILACVFECMCAYVQVRVCVRARVRIRVCFCVCTCLAGLVLLTKLHNQTDKQTRRRMAGFGPPGFHPENPRFDRFSSGFRCNIVSKLDC